MRGARCERRRCCRRGVLLTRFVAQLSNNRIGQLNGLAGMTALEELLVHNNDLTRIEGLEACASLQVLALSHNLLTELDLRPLTQMQHLGLNSNRLTRVDGIELMSELAELKLGKNALRSIGSLQRLTALERLEVRGARSAFVALAQVAHLS